MTAKKHEAPKHAAHDTTKETARPAVEPETPKAPREPEPKFPVGAHASLRGGPVMTSLGGGGGPPGFVVCVWFAQGDIKTFSFPEAALTAVAAQK